MSYHLIEPTACTPGDGCIAYAKKQARPEQTDQTVLRCLRPSAPC